MKTGAEAAPKPSTTQLPAKAGSSQKKGEEKPFFAPSVKGIQTKLKIGSPNDPAEKEADRMADKVTRMPAPATGKKIQAKHQEQMQKKEAPAADDKIQKKEEGVQMKEMADDKVQKKETPATDDKIQKKEEGVQTKEMADDKVQKKETPAADNKIQKKEEGVQMKEMADDKVQKKEAPAADDKIQKKEEGVQMKEMADDKVQKKESPATDDKVQKKGEEKKKDEKDLLKETAKEDKKKPAAEKKNTVLQRKGEGTPSSAMEDIGQGIKQQSAGGHALSDDTKSYMEHRFNADFSNVRVHSGPDASQLSSQAGARAFTYQNHIFFNNNEYQPGSSGGRHLLAHELTHVVQQGHSVQRSEAPAAATAVTPQVQREFSFRIPSWQDALDWMAEKANNIPGFRMFTIVVGSNPINGAGADNSAANILRAIVEFLPGGAVITQALDKYGVFEKAGSWVEGKLKKFSNLVGQIINGIAQFRAEVDLSDIILSPFQTWAKAERIFTGPVDEVIAFIQGLFEELMQFIRDAVLKPLAALAANAPGFDLLCAVIGFNPITNESVPRNADTLIGGFMKMIGRQDIWDNIKKGNAVERAFTWFQNALKGLVALVKTFPQDFIAMLKTIEVSDFINLPNLFSKVFKVFGGFAASFADWAMNTIFDLLEIIFSVVAPGAMPYLQKVRGAFKSILEQPMVFVGHLVNAAKTGFIQFKNRIGAWLKKALVNWLLGSLAGANIYIPQSFTLKEILKMGLSVFGLTWQNIRGKLVKAVGETAVSAMEAGFDILKTLITEGPAAAWDKIQDKIEELKSQFIAEITSYITITVVQAAVTKLLTSLNPAGAFIQAILAIYNTIMFLVQKIQQIAAVGRAVIDSIVEIAGGAIGKAANKVETVLGGMLSLAISFLANFLGLGKISDKVVAIIKKLRAPVDKAIDKVIAWIVKAGQKFLQTGTPKDPKARFALGMQKAVGAVNRFAGKKVGAIVLNPILAGIKARYGFQVLELVKAGDKWSVKGALNPAGTQPTSALADAGGAAAGGKVDPFNIDFQMKRTTKKLTFVDTELTDALQHHQDALNRLSVQQWLTNIIAYAFFSKSEKAKIRQEGKEKLLKADQSLRAEVRKELEAKFAKEGINKPVEEYQIDAVIEARIKGKHPSITSRTAGKHVSHSADFIAGGNIDEFVSLEKGTINSYLGSLWGQRRPILDSYAGRLKQLVPEPKERDAKKMNFTLTPIIT